MLFKINVFSRLIYGHQSQFSTFGSKLGKYLLNFRKICYYIFRGNAKRVSHYMFMCKPEKNTAKNTVKRDIARV